MRNNVINEREPVKGFHPNRPDPLPPYFTNVNPAVHL